MIIKKNILLRETLRLNDPLSKKTNEMPKQDAIESMKHYFFIKPDIVLSHKTTEMKL